MTSCYRKLRRALCAELWTLSASCLQAQNPSKKPLLVTKTLSQLPSFQGALTTPKTLRDSKETPGNPSARITMESPAQSQVPDSPGTASLTEIETMLVCGHECTEIVLMVGLYGKGQA